MILPRDGSVLVRMPAWVGDFVLAEPALRGVLDYLEPGTPVSVLGPERLLELLDPRPGLHRVAWPSPRPSELSAWRGHRTALLFTGSFRSAWSAFRAGIPERVGWSRDARGWLLTWSLGAPLERGRRPAGLGQVGRGRRYLPRPFGASCVELVASVGVPVGEPRPRITPSPQAREVVGELLGAAGLEPAAGYFVVNVGSRPGSAKGMQAGLWKEILDALGRAGHGPFVVVGGPGEEDVAQALGSSGCTADLRFLGTTLGLGQLAALAQGARAFLTTDSGPRHVANAVGARVLTWYGPTDPRHTAEHLELTAGLRRPVACGPCHLERCPLPGEAKHACFGRIPVGEAVERLAELLSREPGTPLPCPPSRPRT